MYNNHTSENQAGHFNVPHNKNIFSSDFPIQVCRNCGYGTYTHRVDAEQLSRYYEEEYANWNLNYIEKKNNFDERSIGQFRFVESHVLFPDCKDILEIGAGAALPSLYLKSIFKHLKTHVIEPNPLFHQYYLSNSIVRIADEFPAPAINRRSFDYVHASHWLEHVIDLRPTLAALRDITTDNGYLFFEVPNCTETYYEYDIKDTPHLHFFTLQSLTALCISIGFKLIRSGTYWLSFKEYYMSTIGKLDPQRKLKAITDSSHDIQNPNGAWLRLLFKKVLQ